MKIVTAAVGPMLCEGQILTAGPGVDGGPVHRRAADLGREQADREQNPFLTRSYVVRRKKGGKGGKAGVGMMHSYQWFLLGMMAAWTPGLVALALVLAHAYDPDPQRHQISPLRGERQ